MRQFRIHVLVLCMALCVIANVSGQPKFNLPPADYISDIEVQKGAISGNFSLPAFHVKYVNPVNNMYRIEFQGSFPADLPGEYDLPVHSVLVQVLPDTRYNLLIESVDSSVIALDERLSGKQLHVVQESALKSNRTTHDNSFVNFEATDIPTDNDIVSLQMEGTIRGVSIGRLIMKPFRYDSLHNELTVYYNIKYQLTPVKDVSIIAVEYNLTTPFQHVLQRVIMDDSRSIKKKVIKDEPITMVILSDSIFAESLQPLIRWKREKGFRVIESYTSNPEVGNTSTSIKEHLKSLYLQPAEDFNSPSFLLIAGDVEHIPLSQSGGQITDLYYTTYDGENDFLPDIFSGRISIKDTAELNHVVDKILMYEKFEFPDASYLNNALLIAGYDASYASRQGNGQVNYASEYYFNPEHGIETMKYLHPEASTLDREILEVISEGASFVNYTGHGEYYGWLDPAFRLHHIDTMKNIHKYSFMIGNGCSTNLFNMNSQDCFAEAIVKVEDRGAIGYIGCTNDSYWNEDFYWAVGVGAISSSPDINKTSKGFYDKVFNENTAEINSRASTMGEMIYAGNMSVQESNSSKKKYYWEIYQLMGDPSIAPWFREPEDYMASYPSLLPSGATRFSVETRPFDYIAVSSGGKLITAMNTDLNGQAYVQLPDSLTGKDLKIVITGDDRVPVFDSIKRSEDNMPYLELIDYAVVNESETSDGAISVGEQFSLQLDVVNSGGAMQAGGSLKLSVASEYVQIADSVYNIRQLDAGDTLRVEAAFRGVVDDSVSNMTSVPFTIEVRDALPKQLFLLKENIHAPDLISHGIRWDDRPYGNGNGLIEKDEVLSFRWLLENRGDYRSDSVGVWQDSLQMPEVEEWGPIAEGLKPGERREVLFSSAIMTDTLNVQGYPTHFYARFGGYLLRDSLMVAFNNYFGDFSEPYTKFRFDQGSIPWYRDTTVYYGGPAAFRSGKTGHNKQSTVSMNIGLQQSDSISFYFKVSSEKSYDFLIFYIDSSLADQWSGNVGWRKATFPLDSGAHYLSWVYSKDENTVGGEDAAWIDQVQLPGDVMQRSDLSLLSFESPVSGHQLTDSEVVIVNVKNTGTDTITGFDVGFGLTGGSWSEQNYPDAVPPDSIVSVTFDQLSDMSELGNYGFRAGLKSENDFYAVNDTLSTFVLHYTFPDLAISLEGIDSLTNEYIDLLIHMANQGNVAIDSINYEILLGGDPFKSSEMLLSLLPGEDSVIQVNLIQSSDALASGWYDFLFQIPRDSVIENNSFQKSVLWELLSVSNESGSFFKVYPNPVRDIMLLELDERVLFPAEMEILNLEGKTIYRTELYDRKLQLAADVVFPGKGIYLVKLTGVNGKQYSGIVSVVGADL